MSQTVVFTSASDLTDTVVFAAPLAIPVGVGVAILGYQLLDIDRVISATASVTVLGVGFLALALAVVPGLAAAMDRGFGLDSSFGE